MGSIEYFSKRISNANSSRELYIKSDISFRYKVVIPSYGTGLHVMESDKLVATISGNNINILGAILPIKRLGISKWGWVLNEKPPRVLMCTSSGYELNEEIVASISSGGEFFPWVYQMIKQRSWLPFEPYIKINFDESKIDSLLALCILLVDVSDSFHTP